MESSKTSFIFGWSTEERCVLHSVIAICVVSLIAALPLVNELIILVVCVLDKKKCTSTYHPNY